MEMGARLGGHVNGEQFWSFGSSAYDGRMYTKVDIDSLTFMISVVVSQELSS